LRSDDVRQLFHPTKASIACFILALCLSHPATAFDLTGKGVLLTGVFLNAGKIQTDWRLKFTGNLKGSLKNGLQYGISSAVVFEEHKAPAVSRPSAFIKYNKTKLSFLNTSGAIASLGSPWGCAAGNRGASCADLVQNMKPGGFDVGMTLGPKTAAFPGVLRVTTQVGKVKLAISGAGGTDTEVVAKFDVGPTTVALGHDSGQGTNGGVTILTDTKKADRAFGFDLGFYGGTLNMVGSITQKSGPITYYRYLSRLGGTFSIGFSYKRKINKSLTLASSIESVGGEILADLGFKVSF
jgi:hypothetical protein